MTLSRVGSLLFFFLAGFTPRAHANATVLLEEPYSYDGALAGTGHTAVYLTRVCAALPTFLRRCDEGEHGVVISRYHRIGGMTGLPFHSFPISTPSQSRRISPSTLPARLPP